MAAPAAVVVRSTIDAVIPNIAEIAPSPWKTPSAIDPISQNPRARPLVPRVDTKPVKAPTMPKSLPTHAALLPPAQAPESRSVAIDPAAVAVAPAMIALAEASATVAPAATAEAMPAASITAPTPVAAAAIPATIPTPVTIPRQWCDTVESTAPPTSLAASDKSESGLRLHSPRGSVASTGSSPAYAYT